MSIQRARSQNLRALASRLLGEGLSGQDAIVEYLGPAFTAKRLSTFLSGGHMPAMSAWALEHRLGKSKGWMDLDRELEIATMEMPPRGERPIPLSE